MEDAQVEVYRGRRAARPWVRDPNNASVQLALAQAVERDPEGAAEWYMELCSVGRAFQGLGFRV
jgi:hypothetical protein